MIWKKKKASVGINEMWGAGDHLSHLYLQLASRGQICR